jgi:2-oxoglutarate ferredoxin oxidoreductase subunit beta
MSETAFKVKDYKSDLKPIWCAGCGDYGAINPFYQALVENQLDPKDTVIVSGIGCSGRFPYFCDTYGFHGVHGRAVPTAAGMKTMTSKTAPYAYVEEPLNPLAMLLAYGASFIARGFSGKPKDLKVLFSQAIQHKGFSVVLIFSPCVTFNKQITFKTMNEIVKPLPEDWDRSNQLAAMEKALDTDSYWTGVVYQDQRPTIHQRVAEITERVGRYDNFKELIDQYA